MTALVQRGVLPTLEAPDDTGKAVIVNPAGDNYVLGAAQSGASVAGLGDYATWHRTGAYAQPSGSFDYVADAGPSSGTSITVDSSPVWVDNWGSPAPVLAEGVYAITAKAASALGQWQGLELGVWDAEGVQLFPFLVRDWAAAKAVDSPAFVSPTQTFFAPAGTHIDVGPGTTGTPASLDLLIQKIG